MKKWEAMAVPETKKKKQSKHIWVHLNIIQIQMFIMKVMVYNGL